MGTRSVMTRVLIASAIFVARTKLEAQQTRFQVSASPILTIGSETAGPSYQFYRIGGVLRLDDGRVVVGNSGSAELRIFDQQGKFFKSVGRAGGGPGDFGSRSILVPRPFGHNRFIVEDIANNRVNLFDFAGTFLRSFQLQGGGAFKRAFVRAVAGTTLVAASAVVWPNDGAPGVVLGSTYAYALFDSMGASQHPLFELPGRPRVVRVLQGVADYPYVPITTDPTVAATGQRIYLLRGDVAEVEVWSLDGKRVGTFKWKASRIPVSAIWKSYTKEKQDAVTGEPARTRYEYLITMELPLPKEVPVASQILIDPLGDLWIERFPVSVNEKHAWDVLDSQGRFLGTVATPARLEVTQVGLDFIIGRSRDGDDIEHVVIHRLTRGR